MTEQININANPAAQQSQTLSAEPKKVTDQKQIKDFEDLLHKGGKQEQETLKKLFMQSEKTLTELATKGSSQTLGGKEIDLDSKLPNSDSMFAALGAQPQNVNSGGNQVAATEQAAASSIISNDDVQKIADRILVSTPKDGSTEIKITINDSVLAGTEISITKAKDGQLHVQFNTNNANSFQSLVAAQDNLKEILKQSNTDVRVEVSQENNDQNRESRGKQDYYNPDEQG